MPVQRSQRSGLAANSERLHRAGRLAKYPGRIIVGADRPNMRLTLPLVSICLIAWPATGEAAPPDAVTARTEIEPKARKHFHIPAADAVGALESFAEQASIPIVYLIENVRGVRTNSVSGELTPREALDWLVVNTRLTVKEDTRSGALMVISGPLPKANRVAQSELRPATEQPRRSRKSGTRLVRGIMDALAPGHVDETGWMADERTVELSPFVVNSARDTGYHATSTLAGTRLNAPLKDLGAAISIYPREFLEDIGATNSGELLQYATAMEAAGPGGNFAGATFNDMNSAVPVPDGIRENPQGSSRARGLVSPTFTRDFFPSAFDIDMYNTERLTVLRGPNPALVGVGSPSGVIDTSLIRAGLSANKSKVVTRYGNNDSVRSTIDLNRVLIDDRLAVRIAGLMAMEKHNQRPSYEHKERVFGTLTYKPLESSTLRGNFETGRMRANRPNVILPINSIPPEWHGAGRPGFDWTFYDDPARNPAAAIQNASSYYPHYMGQVGLQGPFIIFYNNPGDRSPSHIIQANSPTTSETTPNAVKDQLFHPRLNRDLGPDTARHIQTRNIFEFTPSAYWVGPNVLPGQLPGLIPPGLKHQGFTDFSAFDFKHRLLDETAFFTDSFHSVNLMFEQRAWENRLGIELAYDAQRQDRASYATFFSGNNNGHIRIDTTVTLPNGLPNPNLGRPFAVVGANRWTHRDTDDNTLRATAYVRYDFSDSRQAWSRWLGRHVVSGLFERSRRDAISTNPVQKLDGPAVRQIVPNINGRSPTLLVYLGPSLIGNGNPLHLDSIELPRYPVGPIGDISTFVRAGDAVDPGDFASSPASVTQVLNSGQISREVIVSASATVQSYWLRDHLITVSAGGATRITSPAGMSHSPPIRRT